MPKFTPPDLNAMRIRNMKTRTDIDLKWASACRAARRAGLPPPMRSVAENHTRHNTYVSNPNARRNNPLYHAWHTMHQRCYNPNTPAYKYYGARGIYIDQPWHDFDNFEEDMGERPEGYSLDRKDNKGPYSKKNCRWATRAQQARNKGNNVMVTVDDTTLCVKDWAELLSASPQTIYARIRNGWDPVWAVEASMITSVK